MKLKKLAHLIALIGVASPALAQQVQQDPPMARVEITGSSIKRVAKEGALPVQVITFDTLQKQGITSAEQLMATISANGNGADNPTSGNNVFGPDADRVSGGASFASFRGLGPNSTLVLINGRRAPTHGKSGKAVDLNSIPMAAISRIEILKDGASAIYGTDAIGGVMNIILKTNYQGAEASAYTNVTEAGGGNIHRGSLIVGHGDLENDGFNLMATASFTKNEKLESRQRDFANGFQPSRGLSPDTTGTPYANQLTGAGTALGTGFKVPGSTNTYLQANPLSFQGKCDSVEGMSQYQTELWKDVTSPLRSTYSCAYDYGGDYVMQSPSEQTNLLLRGSYKLAPNHTMFVEAIGSRSEVVSILTPAQISTSLANGNAYPVGGQYYQDLSSIISTFDRTKPIIYKWRANPLGNRTQENSTESGRLLVGFEGTVNAWDYKLGLSKAQSTSHMELLDGYANTTAFYKVLGSGIVNPWSLDGSQTKEAMDAIEATKYRGAFQTGKTTLTQIDGTVSGELFQLPAGKLAMAAGFDFRRESYLYSQDVAAEPILLAPGNANLPKASRDVKALFAEFIVPVTKDLELQLAVRRDDYSVIGATTNPKVAFRYQPTNWLLFRGSANKGFLAPSFSQLYAGSLDGELSSGVIDSVGCANHPGDVRFCAPERFDFKSGGNQNLKPETSKQGTLGLVVEPFKGFSASIDWWAINMKDRILNRSATIVLQNPVALSGNIIRNADDTINYVQAGWINAAGAKTRGIDLGLRGDGKFGDGYKWSATLDGTWTGSYKFAEIEGQPYKEYVGQFFTRDLYLRWKHAATFSVTKGDWNVLVSNNFASGYKDQLPNGGKGTPPSGFDPDVSSYTRFGLATTYKGFKNTSITFGIQNLFDRDPPFTAHNVDDVVGAGWDPRVADPRGRAYTLNLTYKFF
ncbi:TonB-dependent receptor [Massilia sp. Mn16-1_5]|uniref:TonB-dependent receptor n=1 Tax=Massilia sp. Mn16-1_5 TaxID=2079199 RepID=UPI00109E8842|nr:TonB-dependent receptor [Massilia sp. Mn16-1_5]THC43555.1 TonB-dependent receptor [Massilia sp. Mn16-1_5]